MRILILNGPNLNLLGHREPALYGHRSYVELCKLIEAHAAGKGIQVAFLQSNHEGALIDAIQQAEGAYDGIIINPGAYAHYSYAIHDALLSVRVPAVEVHITDIAAREPWRQVLVTAPACRAMIAGHGLAGYCEAVDALETLLC